jgi:hypothetical protein
MANIHPVRAFGDANVLSLFQQLRYRLEKYKIEAMMNRWVLYETDWFFFARWFFVGRFEDDP